MASALVERLGCRVLLLFVRHACLLRPLSQAGKLQLAKVSYSSKSISAAAAAAIVPPVLCRLLRVSLKRLVAPAQN